MSDQSHPHSQSASVLPTSTTAGARHRQARRPLSIEIPSLSSVQRYNPPSAFRRTSKDLPAAVAELRYRENQALKRKKLHQRGVLPPVTPFTTGPSKTKTRRVGIDEHLIPLQQLAFSDAYKDSGINLEDPNHSLGLSHDTAAARLRQYGENKLKPPYQESPIKKFFRHLFSVFNLLLMFAGLLCLIAFFIDIHASLSGQTDFVFENLYLAILLFLTCLFSAFFTYRQEAKASNVMKGFSALISTSCEVIRGGEHKTIDARFLVPGDIVLVKGGQKIPADLRIISCNDLKVNNSSITGESEPQKRTVESTHPNPLETRNLMFFGSFCTQGRGVGVAIRTGQETVIGQIATLTTQTTGTTTPLRRDIQQFVLIVTCFALVLGLACLIIGLGLAFPFVEAVVFSIGVIVACCPQALPSVVTLALTITAQRMATKNVLVKNLETVEILGSTTVICTDKTGTLTQNRMTVAHVYYDRATHRCATNPKETHQFSTDDSTFKELLRVAALCNTAQFDSSPENMRLPPAQRVTIGDASESALLKFCHPIKDVIKFRQDNPVLAAVPFNSKNKWQLHIQRCGNDVMLFMKGAPERILGFCTTMLNGEDREPVDEKARAAIDNAILNLGRMGQRVMGFAELRLTEQDLQAMYITGPDGKPLLDMEVIMSHGLLPLRDLTFVGLVSMIDPPREGVAEAVETCFRAGIQVIMVTGDHVVTAVGIARQVGIVQGKLRTESALERGVDPKVLDPSLFDAAAVSGEELERLTERDWDELLTKKYLVFARTSPEQKLTIVSKCQARGAIVGVTGDGVNDSPALKKADIGISMGSGSDVSREAADLILLDDNFASIVNGIEEGRLIVDNLRKSVAYTLTHIPGELFQFLAFVFVGIPLPLGVIMIIAIDLGIEVSVSIAFAEERPEGDILNRPPRSQSDRLVSPKLMVFSFLIMGVIEFLGALYAYFVVMSYFGFPPPMLPGLARRSFLGSVKSAPAVNRYGETLNWNEQILILRTAQTAFFCAILITQVLFNSFCCKTRRLSILQHGIANNFMLVSIVISICIALFLIYTPGIRIVFGFIPIPFIFLLPCIPFAIFMFGLDELRKFTIREAPDRFFGQNIAW